MNETVIFCLLDGMCFAVFWLYSQCFIAGKKLLRKEEAEQWLEGFKVITTISLFVILCLLTGSKAAALSLAILTPIALSVQFLRRQV